MTKSKRVAVSKEHQITVWKRDRWTCRYCGKPVFFGPTLKLLEKINPGHGYYQQNGNKGRMIRLFNHGWASVDHVHPLSHGGTNTLENYVTACWHCNLTLRAKEKAHPKRIKLDQGSAESKWDGLSGLYMKLGPDDAWRKLLQSR